MKVLYKILLSIVVISAAIFAITTMLRNPYLASIAFAQQNGRNHDVPVLNYEDEASKAVDKSHKDKSKHFNKRGGDETNRRVAELREGVKPLPIIGPWWVGLPALPVSQSDVVVLGEVVGRQAHLSEDGTGVYSEFSIDVEEVFKDSTGSISKGSTLSANRIGGGVRFASGKVQKYTIRRQGMPDKGRYVLFLRRTDTDDLLIVTGYDLSGGKVIPLDGEDIKDPRSSLPFAQYRDADESRFIQDLRTAVQQSNQAGGVK